MPYVLGALFVWVIAGCGGGGADSTQTGGKVSLTIAWPEEKPSRYIPPYARSLAFTLYALDTEQPDITLVVNRPEDLPLVQTVTMDGPIIPGHYALVGLAYTSANGNGSVVAAATNTNVVVEATGTTTVPMSLESTLKSIEIQNTPLTLDINESVLLQVKVLDNNDAQVFIPNGLLSWSLVFGGTSVSLSNTGVVKGLAAGSARVRVSEIGAGLYSDGDVSVGIPPDSLRVARPGK